jgi:hypothetical protein
VQPAHGCSRVSHDGTQMACSLAAHALGLLHGRHTRVCAVVVQYTPCPPRAQVRPRRPFSKPIQCIVRRCCAMRRDQNPARSTGLERAVHYFFTFCLGDFIV